MNSSQAISWHQGETRFNYRAAAVCLHEGHVLLHRAEVDSFWSVPGGRVELAEEAAQALHREIAEELGTGAAVGPLQWVVETVYQHRGARYHELGLYFLVRLTNPALYAQDVTHVGVEGDIPLLFRWFALPELDGLDVRPQWLKGRLSALPGPLEHIVDNQLSPT